MFTEELNLIKETEENAEALRNEERRQTPCRGSTEQGGTDSRRRRTAGEAEL